MRLVKKMIKTVIIIKIKKNATDNCTSKEFYAIKKYENPNKEKQNFRASCTLINSLTFTIELLIT